MEVKKQWIVDYDLLLLLEDGTYRIGKTTNLYGFDFIEEKEALKLLENSGRNRI